MVIFCFTVGYSQVEQDPRHHSDLGISYFLSPQYLHSNLRYYYKSPLILKRFHAQLEVEAFHISSQTPFFLAGNYNKFNLIGDINIPLSNRWSMFPFGGIQIAADLTHIQQDPNERLRVGVADLVGVEWMATKGRFVFKLMSCWTIYGNGVWKEIRPKIGIDIWKGLTAHVGVNLALAIASTGLDAGFYPYLGVNYFIPLPQKKKE